MKTFYKACAIALFLYLWAAFLFFILDWLIPQKWVVVLLWFVIWGVSVWKILFFAYKWLSKK